MTPEKYYTQPEDEPHEAFIDLIDGRYEVECNVLYCKFKDSSIDYEVARKMIEDHYESWQAS